MSQTPRSRVYRFGESTLTLEFGDIITSEAEVLVSSDDSYLTMGGGVSAAIRRAGGNAIALDAAKKIPMALGDVAVTTAGALQAQYVFHAVTRGEGIQQAGPREILEKTTRRCMQLAETLRVHSIAFPAIGAGRARFSYEDVAERMSDVIADELAHFGKPVDVSIYLYDPDRPERFDSFAFVEQFARRESRWQEAPRSALRDEARDPGVDVFISYCHKDRAWLKLLSDMLQPLLRKGGISIWDDTRIAAGEDWRREIGGALASAKAAVLLVSSHFLASRFIAEHELPPLLEAAKKKGLTILWVYLSPCLYNEAGIGAFQAAHDISHPLAKLKRVNRDNALVEVCQKIKTAVSV